MEKSENFESLDTFITLHSMSKKYYDSKSKIKRVGISREESCKHIFGFFDYISDESINIRRALIKYYNISVFSDKVDGFVIEKNNNISKIICPEFNNLYSSSIGVHEYTHALNYDLSYKLNNLYVYEEILPFLNQFLFLDFINDLHDSNEVIKTSKYFMIQEQLFLNIINFMNIVEVINTSDGVINKKAFANKMKEHYKYIIGSLYSLQLYEYYKMDEELFMEEYKKIYKENKTVNDLLNYYSISLENKENLILVKSLIEN